MLKAVEKLVTSNHDMCCGNHRVEYNTERGQTIVNFWYFSTIICSVNLNERTFKTTRGNWDTMSTNRAINDYREYFNGLGYEEHFTNLSDLKRYLLELPEEKSCRVYFDHKQVTLSKKANKLIEGLKVAHLTVCSEESMLYDDSYSYRGPKSLETYINEVLFHSEILN